MAGDDLESIGALRRDFPDLRIHIPYGKDEWPEADVSVVPQLIVLDAGKPVQRIIGWQGNRAALLRALDRD